MQMGRSVVGAPNQLAEWIKALPAWEDLVEGHALPDRFAAVASALQSRGEEVAGALELLENSPEWATHSFDQLQSKAFLVLRLLFDLPSRHPVSDWQYFKGWKNWPEPDDDGFIDASWPVDWSDVVPRLAAPYEGSRGRPYQATAEFQWFKERFHYRPLPSRR